MDEAWSRNMKIKRPKVSKGLSFLVTLSLLIVAVAAFIELIDKGPNPLPKFISYFDRPGVTYIKYEPDEYGSYPLWIDYRAKRAKYLYKDKKGKIENIDLIKGEEVRTYDSGVPGISKEGLNESNEPILLGFMKAAKQGDLVKVKYKGGLVYYRLKDEKTYSEEDPERAPQIALDGILGLPVKTILYNSDAGEFVSAPIESVSHLPESSAKGIFNMNELDPQVLKEQSETLGYTAKDLRKFKRFTPYWLGPEVLGAKVSSIKDTVEDGQFQALGIFYGSPIKPMARITAYRKGQEGQLDFDGLWETGKRFRVHGYRAVLRKPQETYIEVSSGVYWIHGPYRLSNDRLIKFIKRNFQRP